MLDKILEEWEKDSAIDPLFLDSSALEVNKLHCKYLKMYGQVSMQLHDTEKHLEEMQLFFFKYYSGAMTKEEMDKHNLAYDPFGNLKKPLKSELMKYVNSDKEIVKISKEIKMLELAKESIKEILDQIKWRPQNIKTIVEYKKFMEGQ